MMLVFGITLTHTHTAVLCYTAITITTATTIIATILARSSSYPLVRGGAAGCLLFLLPPQRYAIAAWSSYP